ncbi:MAG: tRNA epoxyqueuosine(34) reductase QueG [Opitutaceae bacterium]|nr:tRNA epoxyqueuosine(34) reductase QueG [Opitutaceae bacterium]
MNARQEELRRRLAALGFDEVRFARVEAVPAEDLRHWLAWGFHADMAWMERTAVKRLDPGLVLPGVRSVIALGANYWPGGEAGAPGLKAEAPRWARYALYEDYHDTLKPALVAAGKTLEELYGAGGADYRYYVDTGPVLERGWAERAGLGFLGKNGMLISRRFGNWLLLATILTRVEFEADAPLRRQSGEAKTESRIGLLCGKCTRCLEACPTEAIPSPGLVDARRCISYQTIENQGIIPRELRPGIGRHIYGCDICLEVCPWNRFAREGRRMLLAAREGIAALSLKEILELTPARFAEVFRRTPIKRLKLPGLLRNACVVAGNVAAGTDAGHELVAPLIRLAAHAAPMVRAHAVWAVHRIAGAAAPQLLAAAREEETDPAVLAEHTAWTAETGATGAARSSAG